MKHFSLRILPFALCLFFASSASAETMCASSNQCGDGLRCSTERGECRSACESGENCPAVCMGVCEPRPTGCSPYVCKDGTRIAKCTDEGYPISYFAPPCLTHDGEVDGSIRIILPNGGEMWREGDTHNIRWDGNIEGEIDLVLASGHVTHKNIATGISAESGIYEWTIPHEFVISASEAAKGVIGNGALTVQIRQDGILLDESNRAFQIERGVGEAGPFKDVPTTHRYSAAIEYIRIFGLVDGNPDGTFTPDAFLNRAGLTKIITLATADDELADLCTSHYFYDVPQDAWYDRYLCTGRERGIISGYPDGAFRPADWVNFAEAAKIIVNGYGLSIRQTGTWYEGYVRALEDKGAIPQSIKKFDQLITRGEMAEMMYRLTAGITGLPTATYEDLTGKSANATSLQDEDYIYSLSAPEGWAVHRNVSVNGEVFTIIVAPERPFRSDLIDATDHVRIAIDAKCPDLSRMQPTSEPQPVSTIFLGGRLFTTASGSQGAAGSRQIFSKYSYEKGDGRCVVIVTNHFYSNPDMYDEPERSRHWQSVADRDYLLAQVVQSFSMGIR